MDPRPDVVSTYRMLRLALAAMAFAILLGAGVQTRRQDCLLSSISAYWYTPARTSFVACLVVIGVCLVALRGGTWTENLLLNLAGILAPIVAIVPVPLAEGRDGHCLLDVQPTGEPGFKVFVNPALDGSVDNGLAVYFVLVALGYVVALVSSLRRARLATEPPTAQARVARVVGLALGAAIPLALGAWRLADEDAFLGHAHSTSAIAMFACIGLVIGFRTRPLADVSRCWDGYRDDSVDRVLTGRRAAGFSMAYGVIAVAMLVAVIAGFVLARGWDYRVIAVETALLASFVVFWLLQTWQLAGIDEPA